MNVFDISLAKQSQTSKDKSESKAVKTSCVMTISWFILELLGRNQYLLLFNKQFSSKISQILSNKNFSNIFEQVGNKGYIR